MIRGLLPAAKSSFGTSKQAEKALEQKIGWYGL
jgi:hypothetical protein